MNKLDINSILNQLSAHLATIPDDDTPPATVTTTGESITAETSTGEIVTATTPQNVNGNNTVTIEPATDSGTKTASVTTSDTPRGNFRCIVETDDGGTPRQRDLTSDIKSFSIEVVSSVGKAAPPVPTVITLLTIKHAAGEVKKFVPPCKKLSILHSQIVINKLDGVNFCYDLPADTQSVIFENISALDCLNTSTSPRPKSRIVIESEGKPEKLSLPPNTCKIIFEKPNVTTSTQAVDAEDDLPDDLPDFLKYTLKIFETTHFEKIDDEE